MGAAIGMDTEELFNDEDLDCSCPPTAVYNRPPGVKGSAWPASRNHVVGVLAFLCDPTPLPEL